MKDAEDAKKEVVAKREEKMLISEQQQVLNESRISLDNATAVQVTDDDIQNVFQLKLDIAPAADITETIEVLPEIDLLKSEEPIEVKSHEEREVDNLFSFIGDIDPNLRTAQIEGADTLALMADNLFDEIENMFEDDEEDNEILESEDEFSQDDQVSVAESIEHTDLKSNMGSMDIKRVLRNNPLVNSEEERRRNSVVDPNQTWSMLDYAEKYFLAANTKKTKYLDVLLQFTRENIQQPILQSTMDHELSKPALEAFSLIKQITSSEERLLVHGRSIQRLVQMGLKTPELRDEILVHLCRQVTDNDKEQPSNWYL
ncbi:MAG: hypothetical protein SGCHY_002709 [Lobulomycetales sp.]